MISYFMDVLEPLPKWLIRLRRTLPAELPGISWLLGLMISYFMDVLEPPPKWLIRLRRTLPAELPGNNFLINPLTSLATLKESLSPHGFTSGFLFFRIDQAPRTFVFSCVSTFSYLRIVVFSQSPF